MLTRLDRYLLRSNLGVFAAILGLALSVLLMERLIRLADILSGSDNVVTTAARLISNLLPHYLELALPGALLITIIISMNRFSQSREITVLMATGMSLWRIARAYMIFGAALALLSLLLSGWLQPLSRYNYRQIVFELQQSSVVTAFKEMKFVQFKDQTIWSSSVDRQGRILGETFITELRPDGTRRFLFGRSGELVPGPNGNWAIILQDAMLGDVPLPGRDMRGNQLVTRQVSWELPGNEGIFRLRGKDQRELTLSELLSESYQAGQYEIDALKARADLNDRLARAVLLVVLPLMGVVLGLNLRRTHRSGGVVIGILLLLMIQKLLEFGMGRAEAGAIPVWAGFWPLVVALAIASLWLFARAGQGKPLLPTLHRAPSPSKPDGA